jgi:hypothetical protein
MPGPRPGSKKYDTERARLRTRIENSGRAADQEANEAANQALRSQQGRRGMVRGERALGPKGERGRGEAR